MNTEVTALVGVISALVGGLVTVASQSLRQRNGNGMREVRDLISAMAEGNRIILTRLEVVLTRIEGLVQAHVEVHHQDQRRASGR